MSHPYHSAACGCSHDTLDQSQLSTLYPSIDHHRIVCYNESQPGQARRIIRPWEERKREDVLISHEGDAELLLLVPFTTTVKVKTVTLITAGDQAPDTVRLSASQQQQHTHTHTVAQLSSHALLSLLSLLSQLRQPH